MLIVNVYFDYYFNNNDGGDYLCPYSITKQNNRCQELDKLSHKLCYLQLLYSKITYTITTTKILFIEKIVGLFWL